MPNLNLPGTISNYPSYVMHEFELDGCPCKIVEPLSPLPGYRWILKAEYFTAFPAFEIEMLRRGYYFVYMKLEYECGSPRSMAHWDKLYDFLTGQLHFDPKPILFGLSVGGLYIYNWAAKHPDKVGCIYGDNPVCDFKSWPGGKGCGEGHPQHWETMIKAYGFADEAEALAWKFNPVDNLKPLVDAGVPLIHAAATDDTVVPIKENTDVLEKNCLALGGRITVFRHPGGHHPHHAVKDFSGLCDLIEKSALR